MKYGLFLFIPILVFCNVPFEKKAQGEKKEFIYRVTLDGAITPATLGLLQSALKKSREDKASALIVRLDTPGGLASSMDEIIKAFLASPVPVITYVYPPGSKSGSAGVYIMYASHISAMSPATNIGSATPVMIGGGGVPESKDKTKDKFSDSLPEKAGADDAVNLKRKQINHAVAQIRGLAEYHGRNADFAEKAVTEARNITAQEALRIHAIDVVAENEQELLSKIEGRQVRILDKKTTLRLKGLEIMTIEVDFRQQFLAIISNPNIAYILMMAGMLGILGEIQYPGSIFPGVVGSVCLLLALYAMQSIPINYAGLGLILLGIVFLILEVNVISYGMLTVAGIASFILGSMMLVDTGDEFYQISLGLILSVSIFTGLVMAFILYKAGESMRKGAVSGSEKLFSETGTAKTDINASGGTIFIHSELWNAVCDGKIEKDSKVRVISRKGLTLTVEKI